MPTDARRDAIRRAIGPVLITIAGIVIVVVGSDLVGWTVFAVGLTLLIALVFYEVGLSEDRDRAKGGSGPYDRPT